MRVADNNNDQACSLRIPSDFGRHNKHLKYFSKVTSFAMMSAAWRFHLSASCRDFPKASRGAWDKREARERNDGNERTALGGSDGE